MTADTPNERHDVSLDLSATMRTFATGICVLTTFAEVEGHRRHDAVTVRSFASVSLEPPLVSLAVRRDSDILGVLLAAEVWAVSILDVAAVDLAQALDGDQEARARALLTCAASPGDRTGALVLDAPGWLECALHDRHDTGDHTVLIGEVLATGGRHRRPPLVSVNGRLRALSEA
ncbi:flavin reductase (DIM6/NTAB) family NADH-FMN oxidoreductase RutF [Streptomyces aurantiacus]|uniref:flavin reductase family protein n=1 Tax=Streptomyces aurantiacus TaxID=47760 RepID=UPI002794756F|nr:flavin reductase family protein [Streptomyces aurantiacus]MDQ0773213.1 flavin reductase (DIM6/NTAB) family NADH-FMN oxidoreductase RutF [Streptomyces aurantiacus]